MGAVSRHQEVFNELLKNEREELRKSAASRLFIQRYGVVSRADKWSKAKCETFQEELLISVSDDDIRNEAALQAECREEAELTLDLSKRLRQTTENILQNELDMLKTKASERLFILRFSAIAKYENWNKARCELVIKELLGKLSKDDIRNEAIMEAESRVTKSRAEEIREKVSLMLMEEAEMLKNRAFVRRSNTVLEKRLFGFYDEMSQDDLRYEAMLEVECRVMNDPPPLSADKTKSQ